MNTQKLLSILAFLPLLIAKLCFKLIKHQLNYWLAEPFMVIVIKIMKSIRFVFMSSIILSVVGLSVWAYYNPTHAKDLLFSYVPKITIEMP